MDVFLIGNQACFLDYCSPEMHILSLKKCIVRCGKLFKLPFFVGKYLFNMVLHYLKSNANIVND